jgi:hypothetical protein
MSNLNTLDFATLTVLSKMVAAAQKDVRDATEAGSYTVNRQVTVDVTGTVNVGEDYEQEIVLKADPFTMLAVALSHLNGVTIESIVEEAKSADPEYVKSIKAKAVEAWGEVKSGTKTACKGKVTVAKGATATVGVPTLVVSK